ncbi:nuclear transport factor 2 family protein [Streptomyces sp. ST2-7A]|uniref:nuclear transport factor 2 family protein n=1 Tax=Streptomyces sp. ST2-7A TaxID=2907214 RepID=UPI001F36FC08|nr:nuclear transport factor 2 family protein [Streptomyces sp. ST2-7A]MCE7081113.1 nuclear transport factor 2 family protein [Streptomyces sp. ST2-7A]
MTVRTREQATPAPTGGTAFAALYAEVQQFYARHMWLLDSGDAEAWAAGFTEDGVFAPPSAPRPIRGRRELVAGVRKAREELAARREQHRHMLLSLDVEPGEKGRIAVRGYAQIIATVHDEQPRVHLMCVTYDVLVREEDGELRILERRVTRDDRP